MTNPTATTRRTMKLKRRQWSGNSLIVKPPACQAEMKPKLIAAWPDRMQR